MIWIGIHNDIREAYTFICLNYEAKEDEIVLVGFSRGAFAARALNFLLDKLGVLRKAGLRHLGVLYEKWKASYQTEDNIDANTEWNIMRDKLEQKQLLLKDPCITACAAWDTVAALPKDELNFVDQKIPQSVRLAIHALALNEQRTRYTPLLWHEDEGRTEPTRLHQCWFLGSHSDVGGGNSYPDLANITFAWVISHLQNLVGFSEDAIYDVTQNIQTELKLDPPKSSIRRKGNGHYEFLLRLPVEEFQSKTDTHVGWFALAQRAAGWDHRKPLSSGDKAQEKLHWSVQRLLDKKVVSACRPLELVAAQHRPIEEPRAFERSILAVWIARQCHEALRLMLEPEISEQPLPGSETGSILIRTFATILEVSPNGQVSTNIFGVPAVTMSKLSVAIIPIYAVLWPHEEDDNMHPTDDQVPDPWSVLTEAIYASNVSIKVCGEADWNFRTHKNRLIQRPLNGKTFGSPISTLTLIARFRRWIGIPRSIPTLEGQITIPFGPEGDLIGNHDTQDVLIPGRMV